MDAPSKVVYIRQSSSINPTDSSSPYYDTEYASSSFSTVNYATTNQSSNLMPYQWVKISMKTKRVSGHDVDNTGLTTNPDVPVYYDGAEYLYSPPTINATKTGFRVYQITAFAQATSGAGYKLRREISTAGFPGQPGAIFFNGPTPTFLSTEQQSLLGERQRWGRRDQQAGNRRHHRRCRHRHQCRVAAPDPLYWRRVEPHPMCRMFLPACPSSYTTVQGMEDMANSIASYAHGTYASGTTACSGANCWGTAANPKINVFNGDCDLGNGTGYGILIVRGNFHMQGNGSFYGLILVVGQGTMDFNGGGNGEIQGGIFVAKTRDCQREFIVQPGFSQHRLEWRRRQRRHLQQRHHQSKLHQYGLPQTRL